MAVGRTPVGEHHHTTRTGCTVHTDYCHTVETADSFHVVAEGTVREDAAVEGVAVGPVVPAVDPVVPDVDPVVPDVDPVVPAVGPVVPAVGPVVPVVALAVPAVALAVPGGVVSASAGEVAAAAAEEVADPREAAAGQAWDDPAGDSTAESVPVEAPVAWVPHRLVQVAAAKEGLATDDPVIPTKRGRYL